MMANLIEFQHVPGRHTGEHLASAFYYIIKRLGIEKKVTLNIYYIIISYLYCFLYIAWLDYYGQCY